MQIPPQSIINYLLPFVATAGAYSATVQSRVASHAAKGGSTPFHHALSDADLTIQGYLEVALLARFPEISFFSEEQDQSLNAKYFAGTSELEVLIDPIDGTRAYIDGRPNYQIIVTIHDASRIVGALCYMPRLNTCYTATLGQGAYLRTHAECASGAAGVKLDVSDSTGPVLVFNRPDLLEKLIPQFDARDLVREYERDSAGSYSIDLLTKRASSIVSAPAQAIDAGALAFIVQEAGGVVSDERGMPIGSFRAASNRVLQWCIASANQRVHEEVLAALQPKNGS